VVQLLGSGGNSSMSNYSFFASIGIFYPILAAILFLLATNLYQILYGRRYKLKGYGYPCFFFFPGLDLWRGGSKVVIVDGGINIDTFPKKKYKFEIESISDMVVKYYPPTIFRLVIMYRGKKMTIDSPNARLIFNDIQEEIKKLRNKNQLVE
jgi:hypothetical protein